MKTLLHKVTQFYIEGFRSMTVGRWLWALILVKVVLFFLVLRLFFFPDVMEERYDTDAERAESVRAVMTGRD